MLEQGVQALLVFVFAAWSAASGTIRFAESANRVRNTILSGQDSDGTYSLGHRRLMLRNDWLPTKASGGALCLFYAAALLAAPNFVAMSPELDWAVSIAAAVPAAGSLLFLLGISDYRYMRRVLDAEEKATTEAA